MSQYPNAHNLQVALAEQHGVSPDQIVITAGGDEAIDRTIRVCLKNAATDNPALLTHRPTFEMFDVYAHASGGEVVGPEWMDGDFPVDEFSRRLNDQVAMIALVSPNNPTSRSIPFDTLRQLVELAEQRGVHALVDLAYVEFARHDPTEWLLQNSRATMIRSFSKAYGLAGLRLGFAITSDPGMAANIRNVGGPFPTGQASLDLGLQALSEPEHMNEIVEAIKERRTKLVEMLESRGVSVLPSDANFILAEYEHANELHEKLIGRGIAVRIFPGNPLLANRLRITVPRTKCELGLFASAIGISSPRKILDDLTGQDLKSDNSMGAISDGENELNGERTSTVQRQTSETTITCTVDLDCPSMLDLQTGLGFFDHMLTAVAVHAGIGLKMCCDGDLHVDDHHSVEDCGLVFGSAIAEALGDRKGIARFGWAMVPMDEALARVAIDLSGRPASVIDLDLDGEKLGEVATENLTHFFQSVAVNLKCALHVDVVRGGNDHHKAEAAYKGFAKALAMAIRRTGQAEVPSTKGVL